MAATRSSRRHRSSRVRRSRASSGRPADAAVQAGDRVAALSWFGGFADLALAPVDTVFPLPDTIDFPAGAALPINYLTAHFALQHRGQLAAGQTVLVHGAAGGVGTAAIQFARAHGATSSRSRPPTRRRQWPRRRRATHRVRRRVPRRREELTDGRGVDIVVDPVGGERFTDSLAAWPPRAGCS